jgi:hypothetical protein
VLCLETLCTFLFVLEFSHLESVYSPNLESILKSPVFVLESSVYSTPRVRSHRASVLRSWSAPLHSQNGQVGLVLVSSFLHACE